MTGFEWDAANKDKNWIRHRVHWKECEEVFNNKPLIITTDVLHSTKEIRYSALGKTNRGRRLTLIFTARNELARVISARDQSRKERSEYEKTEKI